VGNIVTTPTLPYQQEDVCGEKEPESILDRMTVRREGMSLTKVLAKWKHQLPEDATWEYYYDLKQKFPAFILEDKDAVKGRAMLGKIVKVLGCQLSRG